MTVPLATTTITVSKPTFGEPDEPSTGSTTLATGVRAHLSSPSGFEALVGGDQRSIDKQLGCDPVVGIDATCLVTDEGTGVVYTVVWADFRQGLGLDHTVAGLKITAGRV